MSERFWLILHEPACVPELKVPWPADQTKAVIREFLRARPTATIDHLTIDDRGPLVAHAAQWLTMLDGRSARLARRHNTGLRNASTV